MSLSRDTVVVVALMSAMACTEAKRPLSTDSTRAEASPLAAMLDRQMMRLLIRAERSDARDTIVAMGPAATPYLICYFESPEFTTRWEVANILGVLEASDGVPALVDAVLHDVNSHIRWRSLWALGAIRDPTTPQRFLDSLDHPDPTVRWNAAVGCSMFDVHQAVPRLQEQLESDDPFRRWEAINGLGRIVDPTSVPLLRKVMAGSEQRARREATIVLGKLLEFDGSEEILLEGLRDGDPGVRWRAAMQLGRSHSAAVQQAFEARLLVEQDEQVLEYLRKTLGHR